MKGGMRFNGAYRAPRCSLCGKGGDVRRQVQVLKAIRVQGDYAHDKCLKDLHKPDASQWQDDPTKRFFEPK